VVVGWMLLGLAPAANAERRAALSSVGSCPTREAVIAELRRVLPDVAIVADASGAELRIVVTDHADAYRVEVEGIARTFIDASRACDERARKIAVVVTIALDPPVVEPAGGSLETAAAIRDPKRPPAENSVATVLVAQAVPPGDLAMHMETSGVLDGAGSAAPGGASGVTTGIDMHMVFDRGGLGFVVGTAFTSPVDIPMVGATVRVQRLPMDIALRTQTGTRRTTVALELGPRFAIQSSQGITADMSGAQATRLETGVRGAARFEARPWHDHGLFAALQAELSRVLSASHPCRSRHVRPTERIPCDGRWWGRAVAQRVQRRWRSRSTPAGAEHHPGPQAAGRRSPHRDRRSGDARQRLRPVAAGPAVPHVGDPRRGGRWRRGPGGVAGISPERPGHP
jgi:hypothetical protein